MENKVIFESEKEARRFYYERNIINPSVNTFIKELKRDNLISKSAVEEAEDYEKYVASMMDSGMQPSIKDIEYSIRVIRNLKSKLEESK
jgi:hypothetical protein